MAEAVGGAIGVGDTAITVWDIAKWPFLLAIAALVIAVLYFASPNATVGFKFITPGAAMALVVWLAAFVAGVVIGRLSAR